MWRITAKKIEACRKSTSNKGCENRQTILKIKNYPHYLSPENANKNVDKVDNYSPSSSFPINTTSPAPIVINMSPSIQFSKIKFSISSKEGK